MADRYFIVLSSIGSVTSNLILFPVIPLVFAYIIVFYILHSFFKSIHSENRAIVKSIDNKQFRKYRIYITLLFTFMMLYGIADLNYIPHSLTAYIVFHVTMGVSLLLIFLLVKSNKAFYVTDVEIKYPYGPADLYDTNTYIDEISLHKNGLYKIILKNVNASEKWRRKEVTLYVNDDPLKELKELFNKQK